MQSTSETYPVIGMSPGNSYFKDEAVKYLLTEVLQRYRRTAVLIADVPAIHTYTALGYPETEARNKAIPRGNNLKNRTKRIRDDLGFSEDLVRIINWSEEVENNPDYQKAYEAIRNLYITNSLFKQKVDETTATVLEGFGREITDMRTSVTTANHYLLAEFAFLEFAPKFLGSQKIVYIYHKPWPVYEDYIAGKFDNTPKPRLEFFLLEKPK